MGPTKMLAFAGAATALIATAANAADFPAAPPPQMVRAPVAETTGWYLRGDIGMTNQRVKSLDNALFATTTNLTIVDKNFESGMLFGAGLGYKHNNWFRWDLTGEYRGETGFHGMDTYGGPPPTATNIYTGKKSEWLFLANAYLDLGTWKAITPFVGAGIGMSRVSIHSFRDIDPITPSAAYANTDSKWNFAWALHAGLTYDVTPNFAIELAYRYLHLGDGRTGDIIAYDGTNAIYNPMHFKDITSHDLKFGMRWMFADAGYTEYQPPLIRKY
jgi:opacity protein-like surface antigen